MSNGNGLKLTASAWNVYCRLKNWLRVNYDMLIDCVSSSLSWCWIALVKDGELYFIENRTLSTHTETW